MPLVWLLHWIISQANLCQTLPKYFLGFMASIHVITFNKPSSSLGGGT
jgi:hypothetical protein